MTSVLCAGDAFITAEALARAARAALGGETDVLTYQTRWPEEPYGPVESVREASGDVEVLAGLARDVDVVLTHLAPITRTVLGAATRLRVVGVTRGGPVNADLAAATERGVPVVFLPGRNLNAVAEYAVGLMVSLPRRVGPASRALAEGSWQSRYFAYDLTGPELGASTVGLVGFGAVGRRVAELLRGFGSPVLAFDPKVGDDVVRRAGAEPVSWPDLLARSDIVSLHARLDDSSRRMLDDRAFAAMRPGAYLVNTARGELVDRAALLRALESGRLAGAALDVFDPEPPAPGDPLLARPDVLATPHLAGASRQVALESVRRVGEEVAGFLASGSLQHCANPAWVHTRSRC